MVPIVTLLKLGRLTDPVLASRLINRLRPAAGALPLCRLVFDLVPYKDAPLWTSIISAYARSRAPSHALLLLSRMRHPPPSPHAFSAAARAAASLFDLRLAAIIHAAVTVRSFLLNVVVATSVLDMYCKCGEIGDARKLFDGMPERNVITSNSMLAGYVSAGMWDHAFDLFREVRSLEFGMVDEFTVASVLAACSDSGEVWSGSQVHCLALKEGFGKDVAVVNAAGSMYFRCGELEMAEEVMEGSWGVLKELIMVRGYAFGGRFEDVIRRVASIGDLLRLVSEDHGVVIPVLSACSRLSLLRIARQVHGVIILFGWLKDCRSGDGRNTIIGSALIDTYFRCSCVRDARLVFDDLVERDVCHWNSMIVGSIRAGLIGEARNFFDEMPERNIVSWTSMISGYSRNGWAQEGLSLVPTYYKECGLRHGSLSVLTAALDACSCLAALNTAKELHGRAIRTASCSDSYGNVMLETALVDMYGKAGELNYARGIFDRMETRNVVSWTSMLNGYAAHGLAFEALAVFEEIAKTGLKPNEVTFVAVLSACNHGGLLHEGIRYFQMMKERYNIIPRSDHYACIVDLLARAGKLSEAWNLVEGIKDLETNAVNHALDIRNGRAILGSLISRCGLHGDVEMTSKLAHEFQGSEGAASDTYITLSNLYAFAERWDEVYNIRRKWKMDCIPQGPGASRVQAMMTA